MSHNQIALAEVKGEVFGACPVCEVEFLAKRAEGIASLFDRATLEDSQRGFIFKQVLDLIPNAIFLT